MIKKILPFGLLCLLFSFVVSCSDDDDKDFPPTPEQTGTFTVNDNTVDFNGSQRLKAEYDKSDYEVEFDYESSNLEFDLDYYNGASMLTQPIVNLDITDRVQGVVKYIVNGKWAVAVVNNPVSGINCYVSGSAVITKWDLTKNEATLTFNDYTLTTGNGNIVMNGPVTFRLVIED